MHKVVIIGAGTSGLATALRLATSDLSADFEIAILEARNEAGGRTRSYVDEETGDTLDNGQHLLMGCYSATEEYLELIDTAELVSRSHGLTIPFALYNEYSGNCRQAIFRTKNFLPAPLHALGGLLATDLLTAEEKLAAIRFSTQVSKLLELGTANTLSCLELFTKLKQPEGLIRKLWEPLTLATLNARPESASAIPLLSVLKLALLGKRSGATFLFPDVGLSELLVTPALKKLGSRGVRVEFRRPVSSISHRASRFEIRSGDQLETADSVIVAAPFDAIQLPVSTPPATSFSPIVNAYFWLDRPLLSKPIQAFVGTTVQWAFSKPTGFGKERIALTVSAADELVGHSNEEIEAILWQDLQRTLGATSRERPRLIRSQIIREKRATPLFTPEAQLARSLVTTDTPNFYFAGDLVQNMLPATIEGAIRNGFAAAEVLLQRAKGPDRKFDEIV